jgi:hypothetical protein
MIKERILIVKIGETSNSAKHDISRNGRKIGALRTKNETMFQTYVIHTANFNI